MALRAGQQTRPRELRPAAIGLAAQILLEMLSHAVLFAGLIVEQREVQVRIGARWIEHNAALDFINRSLPMAQPLEHAAVIEMCKRVDRIEIERRLETPPRRVELLQME